MGIVAAMAAVGGGAGIVLAGPIVSHLDYHWLFWIPLVIRSSPRCAPTSSSPSRRSGPRARISWWGAVLLSGWLVALLLGVSEAPTWGWGSPRVLGLIAAAVVIGVAWVVVSCRSREPLVDMQMMRVPAVWTNNLVALLFGVGMYSVIGFLPEFLQTPKSTGYGFGASIIQSGVYLLPLTVTMFVVGHAVGPDRRGHRLEGRGGHRVGLLRGGYLVLAFAHTQPVGDLRWPAPCSAWDSASPSPPCPISSSRPCRRPRPGWPAG